jgi:hypothetical protein
VTRQVADMVEFEEGSYDLVQVKGGRLPTPEDFGYLGHAVTTACWRAYRMAYAVEDGKLRLKGMEVDRCAPSGPRDLRAERVDPWQPSGSPFRFRGVAFSVFGARDTSRFVFHDFDVRLTGTLLLGRGDECRQLSAHGFEEWDLFDDYVELSLDQGVVTNVRRVGCAEYRATRSLRPPDANEGGRL